MSRVLTRSSPFRAMPRERQRRPDNRPLADLCLRPGERPRLERRPIVTTDHQPVMVEEVLHFLAPRPEGIYLDCTIGAGGHSEAILHATGGRGKLIGVDKDPDALARARFNLQSSHSQGGLRLVRADFAELEWIVKSAEVDKVDGILLDLGMSSMQIDDAGRGFSFRGEGPLDMRMDPSAALTAADVVNSYPEVDVIRILRAYGEERHAPRIARAIVAARRAGPLRTTTDLANLIERAYPHGPRRQHPARRTFQALRIEVNGELRALEQALRAAPDVLNPGGRIVVISYHSLEDRMVKRIFQSFAGAGQPLPGLGAPKPTGVLAELSRGAVLPSDAETQRNSRASASRLRAAVRRPDLDDKGVG